MLPEEIGCLQKLQILDLSRNNIKSLPKSIGNLANLELLDLSANDLQIIPQEIVELRNLRWLDLNFNRTTTLPDNFDRLQQLEYLDIAFTHIDGEEFPDEVWNLSSLRTFLALTSLISIPPSIENLEKLEHLEIGVRGNLPKEFGNLKNLTKVFLSIEGSINMLSLSSLTNLQHLVSFGIWLRRIEKNFDFRQMDFVRKMQQLEYFLFQGNENDYGTFDFMLDLVKTTPSVIELHRSFHEDRPIISNELSINRFRKRSPFRGGRESSSPLLMKMWPRMLSNASRAFHYPENGFAHFKSSYSIAEHDAVHRFLVDGRESFLEVIRDRNSNISDSADKSSSD